MQPGSEPKALLNANLSAALSPAITVIKASGATQAMPVAAENGVNGFAIDLNFALPYDTLSNALQTFLQGKRLVITEGFFNQSVVLEGCTLYSDMQNKIVAEVPFSGSYSGTFYLTGTPFYNSSSRQVELQNVAYDLKTKSLILKGAKWLFGKVILDEIKKYTAVDLASFYTMAAARVTEFLNKEWTKGIAANGSVKTITITGLAAQQNQLVMTAQCSGELKLTISELQLGF